MAKIVIDADRALELLEAAVAERGEGFVYGESEFRELGGDSCKYVVNGQVACLVGLALNKAGVPIGELEALDSIPMPTINSALAKHPIPGFEITEDAVKVLREAQSCQDLDETWGQSLLAAKAVVVDEVTASL